MLFCAKNVTYPCRFFEHVSSYPKKGRLYVVKILPHPILALNRRSVPGNQKLHRQFLQAFHALSQSFRIASRKVHSPHTLSENHITCDKDFVPGPIDGKASRAVTWSKKDLKLMLAQNQVSILQMQVYMVIRYCKPLLAVHGTPYLFDVFFLLPGHGHSYTVQYL